MNITLIDFWADWCSPCKIQDPIIEELKKKYENKVEFRKINVDGIKDEKKLTKKHNVSAVPTLIIEKDGEVVKKYIGVTTLKVIEREIDSLMKEE